MADKIVMDNIAHENRLHTDRSRVYMEVGGLFGEHEKGLIAVRRNTCAAMFM